MIIYIFRYHYHVLISENWNDVKYYYGPICYDSNCNGTTDYKGINIATFRQPIESREMAQLAQKWAEIWHENITAIMKYSYTFCDFRMALLLGRK